MKKLVVHDIYRDGGTMLCYERANPDQPYYIDKRIGTGTHSKVYDKYPGDIDAKILDIEYQIYNPNRI